MMAAGLGVLRLPPRDFWAMTPRELAAAIRGLGGASHATALGARELHDLMHLFPD